MLLNITRGSASEAIDFGGKRPKLYKLETNNSPVGSLQGDKKGGVMMKGLSEKVTKIAAFSSVLLALIVAGCVPQTGTTARQYDENWYFMPGSQENSFQFGAEYRRCDYDMYYEGYWCPVDI